MAVSTADPLSSTFAALGDPTRRAIVERLARGEATLHELAEPFSMSLQAVAKHLKVLERAGLVVRGRSAQRRPARLAPGSLGEVTGWLERYRAFFEESYERLEEHLAEPDDDRPSAEERSESNERERGTP